MQTQRLIFWLSLALFALMFGVALTQHLSDQFPLYGIYSFVLHPYFAAMLVFFGPQAFILIPVTLVLLAFRWRVGALVTAAGAFVNALILAMPESWAMKEKLIPFGPMPATILLLMASLFLLIGCAVEPYSRWFLCRSGSSRSVHTHKDSS